jgi:hypothetical protein
MEWKGLRSYVCQNVAKSYVFKHASREQICHANTNNEIIPGKFTTTNLKRELYELFNLSLEFFRKLKQC